MSDALLTTAARLLRREARQIRDANTEWRNGGASTAWSRDSLMTGAKADYLEMMSVARQLSARAKL